MKILSGASLANIRLGCKNLSAFLIRATGTRIIFNFTVNFISKMSLNDTGKQAGNSYLTEMLSTIDLLVRITCFVKKEKN